MTLDNDTDKFSLVTIKKCSIYNLEKYFLKNHVIFLVLTCKSQKWRVFSSTFVCLWMENKTKLSVMKAEVVERIFQKMHIFQL